MATPLPAEEMRRLQQRWRETFARRVKQLTGKWTDSGFDWHTFSRQYVYALDGDEAHNAYRKAWSSQGYVLPQLDDPWGYRICSDIPPDFSCKRNIDVAICPLDFSWTMVYTHEDDLFGPYFTKAAWADKPTQPLKKD